MNYELKTILEFETMDPNTLSKNRYEARLQNKS